MTLGDYCLEEMTTPPGHRFKVEVYAVEPVSDIAVLGQADGQEFYADAEAFEAFCEETLPVRVCSADFDLDVAVPVHILTHTGAWIRARATRYGPPGDLPGGRIWLTTEASIESGTSGGPVIDESGDLVGDVSWCGGPADEPATEGMMPRPHLALPGWIWRRIALATTAMSEDNEP
jgi:S1-C subfamily serine protease